MHTQESIRVRYFVDLLMDNKHPVMLVGNAGCGKTVLVGEKLVGLSENYAVANVPFNFYTTSGECNYFYCLCSVLGVLFHHREQRTILNRVVKSARSFAFR